MNDLPVLQGKVDQTAEQRILALIVRRERRVDERMVRIIKTIKQQRAEQQARYERFEKDMAARRRRGVFTSSQARRWAVFTLVSACAFSFVLGTLLGAL